MLARLFHRSPKPPAIMLPFAPFEEVSADDQRATYVPLFHEMVTHVADCIPSDSTAATFEAGFRIGLACAIHAPHWATNVERETVEEIAGATGNLTETVRTQQTGHLSDILQGRAPDWMTHLLLGINTPPTAALVGAHYGLRLARLAPTKMRRVYVDSLIEMAARVGRDAVSLERETADYVQSWAATLPQAVSC